MNKILYSLDHQVPLSVVSVGATETFVLAQYHVLSESKFMKHDEARVAKKGKKRGHEHRGIRFPNINARDLAIQALRKVDVVGYNLLLWYDMESGQLTEKVFDHYDIWPKYIFEAHIRRVIMFSQQEKFHQMLQNRKILIVCSYADEVKKALISKLQNKLHFEIVATVKIEEFEDLERSKEEIKQYNFDLCLLAAGINAVILAPFISSNLGKVAFDLGQGMESLITGEIVDEPKGFIENTIGLDNLLKL